MKELVLNKVDILKKSDYHQFYLGFLTQNDTYINRVWNEFINVTYKPDIGKLDFVANPYNWFYDTPLKIEGFLLENSWDVLLNDYEEWILDRIKKKIDEGKYAKICGDVYYIPFRSEYMKTHLQREIYIYGYDDHKFICIGLDGNNIVSRQTVDSRDLLLFIKKNDFIGDKYRCEVDFYEIKQNLFYEINLEIIKNGLSDYLNASEYVEPPIGEKAMRKATEELFVKTVFYNNCNFLLDYRDLMVKRLIQLQKFKNLDKQICEYRKIESIWAKTINDRKSADAEYLFDIEHQILNEILLLL